MLGVNMCVRNVTKCAYMSASSSLLLVSAEKEVPRLRSVSSSVLHVGAEVILHQVISHEKIHYDISMHTQQLYSSSRFYLHVPIPIFDFLHVYNPSGFQLERIILKGDNEINTKLVK